MSNKLKKVEKLFRPSSWSIDNPTIIYVVIAILLFKGVTAYFDLPREAFPEVKENKVYVSIPYPGNSAEDIERLLIDPLEDELTNISHVVQTNSTSQQDYGMIIVEFDETIQMFEAKQKVTDEVDAKKAGADWPTFNGAKVEPNVFELSLSEEMPVMNINITGDYPLEQLKEYGEYLEDKIEQLPQIKDVAIRGIQEKEVEIALDVYKMMAAKVSFNDVLQSISNGNMTISAGNLIANGQHRTIRVIGEINAPEELNDFVVKSEDKSIYLSDIAEVYFKPKDRTSYARKFDKEVVMLDIKKRAGKKYD
jgi:multidrug efflux pump subunit AcrB